jgi:EAL domain-containing protein (putative c-di-GMP-specific phosphodiesterase class I)/GGDEF domain-containing protein
MIDPALTTGQRMTAQRGLGQAHEYVGFAFAAADLLLETDDDGRITFAVGAAMALLNHPARQLPGLVLGDMAGPRDRTRLRHALERMAAGERVRNLVMAFARSDKNFVDVSLSGYRSPSQKDRLLIAVAHARVDQPGRDPGTGVLDKDSFRAMAKSLLEDSPAEAPYLLTMFELPDLETFRAQAGPEAAEAFAAELGRLLKGLSIGGDAVGQLAENRFGVVHAPEVTADSIGEAVAELSKATAPEAIELSASATSLVLDCGDVAPDEVTRALMYTLTQFADEDSVDMASLSANLQPRLSQTVQQMNEVRITVETGSFQMVYQPIVDLWTNVVHHFECLVRFDGNDASPYETVTFAEDTGLVGMLDIAVTERVVKAMRSGPEADPSLRFAVNLSGRTLSDPAMVHRLRDLLRQAGGMKKRLLFELTESAAVKNLAAVNDVIQEIRGRGHEVCLDDFGAGNAAFHYLRALKVDHVKIDGSYIKSAMHEEENVSFIKAIVSLCSDLGIQTVAEYVEDAETANLLKLLRVRYGQGYYFGKPFRPTEAADARASWLTPRTEWRKGLLYFKG